MTNTKKKWSLDRSQLLVVLVNAIVIIICFFLNYFLVTEKSLELERSSFKGKVADNQLTHLLEIQAIILLGRQEGNINIPGTYLTPPQNFLNTPDKNFLYDSTKVVTFSSFPLIVTDTLKGKEFIDLINNIYQKRAQILPDLFSSIESIKSFLDKNPIIFQPNTELIWEKESTIEQWNELLDNLESEVKNVIDLNF